MKSYLKCVYFEIVGETNRVGRPIIHFVKCCDMLVAAAIAAHITAQAMR